MAGIELNLWHSFFLAASAQGLFLAIVLLTGKRRNKANYFLSALTILFSISLVFYVMFWSGSVQKYLIAFKVVLKFVLLYGPLAYLYVKSLKGIQFKPADLKHFFLFFLVGLLSFIQNENINQFVRSGMPFIECGSLLFYSVLIFKELRFSKSQLSEVRRFLKQYSLLFLMFTLSYVSYYILAYLGILKLEYDYAVSFSMSVLIYFIGYRGYYLPQLYDGNVTSTDKYERSSLTSKAEEHYAHKIQHLMKVEKLFTNSELRLRDLADILGISSHHTSQVINSFFKQSFSELINNFRVEESKRMMSTRKYDEETLIGIAYACGFNNKVSFNNAFQKITGLSPGNYRKLTDQEKSQKRNSKYLPVEA